MRAMTCATCTDLLVDYERGELAPEQDALVFAHVQSCEACAAALRADLELVQQLRASFEPERELPMSVVAGVRQAARGYGGATLADRVRALLRPAILGPMAAVLILGVGFFQYQHTQTASQPLSADYFVREHVAQTIGSPSTDQTWATYVLTSANAQDNAAAGAP